MLKAIIVEDKYGNEIYLIIENKETKERLVGQYFDSCEPYITPREFLNHLGKLGVKYEVEVVTDAE